MLLGETAGAWTLTDVAEPVITLTAPPTRDVSVTIRCRAMFGPLETTWTEGPVEVAAATSIDAALHVPPEAFLHDLSASYVTDLLVRLEPSTPDGQRAQELQLPPVFVAWPAGRQGSPVVWSKQDAVTRAPGGVVDPALAPAVVDGPADVIRVLPPIWHEVHPARPVTDEAFDGARETVPIADPNDEEVAP